MRDHVTKTYTESKLCKTIYIEIASENYNITYGHRSTTPYTNMKNQFFKYFQYK